MSPASSGAHRLLVLAHGPTADLRAARFGGAGGLSHREVLVPPREPVTAWFRGPEPACVETVARLGGAATAVDTLAGPRFGEWTGRTLVEVAAADPDAVGAWMSDPAVVPPGGESLAALVDRVGSWVADLTAGWSAVVVTPLVARAVVVAALNAPADLVFGIDVAPGGRVVLTRAGGGGRWRLQELG